MSSGSFSPLMFVYRHSAVRSEADDLRDAILLFHPSDTPLDSQCLLAGQLMGLTGFVRSTLRTQPVAFELDSLRLACIHDGDLTLCVATPIAGFSLGVGGAGESTICEAASCLLRAFQFYCGPLALAFWSASRHCPEVQTRFNWLSSQLLDLFCPAASPPAMLQMVSGHVTQFPLRPQHQRQQQQQQQKPEVSPPRRNRGFARLLLAADCLADRLINCCNSGALSSVSTFSTPAPRRRLVIGCAIFAAGQLLTSVNLPASICTALSIMADVEDFESSPLPEMLFRIDLSKHSRLEGEGSDQSVFAFHSFVSADEVWSEELDDLNSEGFHVEDADGCWGRCERAVPRLASLCREAVLARQFRQAVALEHTHAPVRRYQCIWWRRCQTDDLRVVALTTGSACLACVQRVAEPLLTSKQLRPLTDALAAADAARNVSSSVDDPSNNLASIQTLPSPPLLLYCPPLLLTASSADAAALRFPDNDSSLSVAAGLATELTAPSLGDFATVSIRIDGRLCVSASRSAGLLSLSDSVDLTVPDSAQAAAAAAAAVVSVDDFGASSSSMSMIGQRRFGAAATPPSMRLGAIGAGVGSLLQVPRKLRRTRSLIGGWRPSSRGF